MNFSIALYLRICFHLKIISSGHEMTPHGTRPGMQIPETHVISAQQLRRIHQKVYGKLPPSINNTLMTWLDVCLQN